MFLVSTSAARAISCPCQNGGVCKISGSQTCACPTGYSGRFCESLISNKIDLVFFHRIRIFLAVVNKCPQIQCANGGTCYENTPDSSGLAYCLCKNGYTGTFCEIG